MYDDKKKIIEECVLYYKNNPYESAMHYDCYACESNTKCLYSKVNANGIPLAIVLFLLISAMVMLLVFGLFGLF